MFKPIIQFIKDQEGTTVLEYGLMAALLAGVIVTAVQTLGTTVSNTFNNLAASMR